MLSFIFRRFLSAIPFFILVSLTVFVIIQLPPGDYVDSWAAQMSASGSTVDAVMMANERARLGLDQPMIVQYVRWISDIVLHGDFGRSFTWNQAVSELIGESMGYTVLMTVGSLFLSWMIALPIGVYSAVKRYSVGDYAFTFISFVGLAIPPFLLALILMYLVKEYTGQVLSGLFSEEFQGQNVPWSFAKFFDLCKHLVIPVIIIGISASASLIRIMRANLIDQLSQPYVVTARAKGLTESRLLFKYPVRVALNPFVSTLGSVLPTLVNGGTTVSIVLSMPTAGQMLYNALLVQDIYLSGALLLLICLLTVVGTLISDILLAILDPRIRMD
ncbi:ABC transporter permease [Uliginosibacterium sp. sgz301328]|uniref:ABC transporter permease n=1 Tax=Uliginosibacterium sp. sgz301328 TaxID=3243764 RepID=UPI00359ECC18